MIIPVPVHVAVKLLQMNMFAITVRLGCAKLVWFVIKNGDGMIDFGNIIEDRWECD